MCNQSNRKKLYTIEDLHNYAQKMDGKCLSEVFTRVKDLYKWQCKCGYQWKASFNNILFSNNWCPRCGGRLKGTIEEMQLLAKQKNGKCLSKIYTNNKTKLEWECEHGHIWWATPDVTKNRGSWCKECSNYPTYTIEKLKKIARDRGGICLSETYENYRVEMKWQCEKGHIWYTATRNILKGHWCHECANSLPKDLNHLIGIALSRNGKLLSTQYMGMKANYKWECEEGHQWYAPACAVKSGRWCHECRKISLKELDEMAKSKGGRCLSTEYINQRTPVKFICKEEHIFYLNPTIVMNKNAWCTICNTSIPEEKCRLILELLVGKPFKKTRKIIGDNLELDGYYEELENFKLAFEYQGEQHFKFNKHYHTDSNGFIKQILIDLEKRHRCSNLGIKLIVIPYTMSENLIEFIKNGLTILNIPFNREIKIDLDLVYKSKSKIEKLREIAESFNGELLTTHYQHYLTKLDLKCLEGHFFKLVPYDLTVLGKWCKYCNKANEKKAKLKKLIEITAAKGGKCLSTEYIDSKTHLNFECKYHHQWRTSPAVIFKGHWCPECAILAKQKQKSYIE